MESRGSFCSRAGSGTTFQWIVGFVGVATNGVLDTSTSRASSPGPAGPPPLSQRLLTQRHASVSLAT